MVYLKKINLPSESVEIDFIKKESRTCFNTFYPFKIFTDKGLRNLEFDSVTMLYGGNGSGKSTLINVISQKMNAVRYSDFNGSPFFDAFVKNCSIEYRKAPERCYVLTSDDVFDYVLSARSVNEKIEDKRNALFDRYVEIYGETLQNPEKGLLKGLDDYDRWSETREILSKRHTQSSYIKKRVARDIDLYSNGETAVRYFIDRIDDDAVYFLDEPENSLSIELQIELSNYIEASARATQSQFIIATHSPIFLSMRDAKIYNLDANPASVAKWTDLPNVRKFFEFFMDRKEEFI